MRILWLHGGAASGKKPDYWQAWNAELNEVLGTEKKKTMTALQFDFGAFFDVRVQSERSELLQAMAVMAQGQPISGRSHVFRQSQVHSILEEMMLWTAGKIVEWTRKEKLRAALRRALATSIAKELETSEGNLTIAAHSVGSLIAYDTLLKNPELARRCILVTFGSQLAHPTVLSVFGGRILPLPAGQWFHLFNPHDPVFTARLTLTAPNFSEIITSVDHEEKFANHFPVVFGAKKESYLDHIAARELLWPEVQRLSALEKLSAKPAQKAGRARKRKQGAGVLHPSHRALLIGIDRYQSPSIPALQGCVNDTYLISAVLQECGMKAENIRLLHNERATAQAIRDRLEWLLEGAAPGDSRVLYFAGHGAQLESYSTGEVVDRQDECLAAWDFAFSRASSVLDDDLWRLYSQLPYDTDFVAIMDCCHAGGTHRGQQRVRGIEMPGDVRHRGMYWNPDRQMWQDRPIGEAIQSLDPQAAATRKMSGEQKAKYFGRSGALRRLGRASVLRQLDDTSYDKQRQELGHHGPYLPLILQACGEAELAGEYDHGSVSHGAFTFCVAEILKDHGKKGGSINFEHLMQETTSRLRMLGFKQTPQLVGPRHKTSQAVPLIGHAIGVAPPKKTKPAKQGAHPGWTASEDALQGVTGLLPIIPRPLLSLTPSAALPPDIIASTDKRLLKRPATKKAAVKKASARQREIIGAIDGRWTVADTAIYPFRAIALLLMRMRDGGLQRGTGFFIGSRVLLTAGHCLLNRRVAPNDGEWQKATEIQVYPGWQPQLPAVPMCNAEDFRITRKWDSDARTAADDYGLILLPKDAPTPSSWLGVRPLPGHQLVAQKGYVVGYPDDFQNENMYAGRGFLGAPSNALLPHAIDTKPGQSGAPIFIEAENSVIAVGIHTRGGSTSNWGVHITTQVLDDIFTWASAWQVPLGK